MKLPASMTFSPARSGASCMSPDIDGWRGQGRDTGGAEEDRTPDLRIANATLSRLSYGPVGRNSIAKCRGGGYTSWSTAVLFRRTRTPAPSP